MKRGIGSRLSLRSVGRNFVKGRSLPEGILNDLVLPLVRKLKFDEKRRPVRRAARCGQSMISFISQLVRTISRLEPMEWVHGFGKQILFY
jgi:hypothetical protein